MLKSRLFDKKTVLKKKKRIVPFEKNIFRYNKAIDKRNTQKTKCFVVMIEYHRFPVLKICVRIHKGGTYNE